MSISSTILEQVTDQPQIFALRTLLPDRLVNPTRAILQSSNGSAPEKLAAQLKDAAVTGSADIQRFKKDYQSEDMRELFRKVNAAEITQGQDVWSTDYVALATRLKDASGSGAQASSEQQYNEDVSDLDVIKQFREQHSTIDVIMVNESIGIPCEVIIDGIVFLVENTKAGYHVLSQGNGKQADLAKRIATYITKQHVNTKLQDILVCCDGTDLLTMLTLTDTPGIILSCSKSEMREVRQSFR
jgi:hypothetical protein